MTGAPVRVACVGLGPIGRAAVDVLEGSPEFDVVALVDPASRGERLGELTVAEDIDACSDTGAEVAILATGSSLSQIEAQIRPLLHAGMDVVSTSEELTYPWLREPERATQLDELALANDKTVVATGVNPGFIMDMLPVIFGTGSLDPHRIGAYRHVDLTRRRDRLREKVGIGLTLEDWNAQGGADRFGHAGLAESAYLCALGLGWKPVDVRFVRKAVCEDDTVIGIREVADLTADGDRSIQLGLYFIMNGDDRDEIEIDGTPGLRVLFQDGLSGDSATVARVLHAARVVGEMPPGLRLPLELPVSMPLDRDERVLVVQ